MTALVAASVNNAVYAGEEGNLSADLGLYTFAAGQIGDTVDLQTIPAGTQLLDLDIIFAALGAGSTLSFGWRYKDGSAGGSATALLAATSTAAAGVASASFTPITFLNTAILYATIAGGAVTGELDTRTTYIYKGTL